VGEVRACQRQRASARGEAEALAGAARRALAGHARGAHRRPADAHPRLSRSVSKPHSQMARLLCVGVSRATRAWRRSRHAHSHDGTSSAHALRNANASGRGGPDPRPSRLVQRRQCAASLVNRTTAGCKGWLVSHWVGVAPRSPPRVSFKAASLAGNLRLRQAVTGPLHCPFLLVGHPLVAGSE
jgi:hypothetical protein